MAEFVIKLRNDFPAEMRRLMLFKLNKAIDNLDNKENSIHDKIHDVRKDLKAIRAVIRAFRNSTDYSIYYRENIFYRDLGRRLAEARDNHVFLEQAIHLKEIIPDNHHHKHLEDLAETLKDRRDRSVKVLMSSTHDLNDLRTDLLSAKQRILELDIKNEGFDVVKGGVKRMYRQGREYFKKLRKEPDHVVIHDLRKRTKYLWLQMKILKKIYPRQLKALSKSQKDISDLLGVHRDLTIFRQSLEDHDFYALNEAQKLWIKKWTDEERDRLFRKAMIKSKKFYLMKPSEFSSLLQEYHRISINPNIYIS